MHYASIMSGDRAYLVLTVCFLKVVVTIANTYITATCETMARLAYVVQCRAII